GGEKGAARRTSAPSHETRELACLEEQKGQAEEPRQEEEKLCPPHSSLGYRDTRHCAEERGSEQAAGLECDAAQVEELSRRGPASIVLEEHRVRCEERREHDDVGEQKDPEPVPDDDALRRGSAGSMAGRLGGRGMARSRGDAIGCWRRPQYFRAHSRGSA